MLSNKYYDILAKAGYKETEDVQVRFRSGTRDGVFYTPNAVRTVFHHLINHLAPFDAQVYLGKYDVFDARVQVERCHGVAATLYFSNHYTSTRELETSDGKVQVVYTTLHTEINWAGTSRNITEAQASIDLYQELTQLARNVEVILGSLDVYLLHHELD